MKGRSRIVDADSPSFLASFYREGVEDDRRGSCQY